jgi:glutathione synthase/RimK-type ligase-like ATP-grasp enzyme
MDDKIFNIILEKIARENDYELTRVIDGVYELKKGSKKLYIRGKKFGLNSALSSSFAKNKAQTFEILRRNNIKAVPHYELYQPARYAIFGDQEKRNKERIKSIIEKDGLPLVLKPAEGERTRGVKLCSSKAKINRFSRELFSTEKEVVLSPFRKIEHEYRTVFLNGKIELIYEKTKVDDRVKHGKFVFGVGAEVLSPENKKYKKLAALAKKSAKTLGLTFASVDIIETEKEGLEVLEINSMVCLKNFGNTSKEYFEIVEKIYKKAFRKAFSKKA